MSCDLKATGAFKRMSGLWLPDSQRSLFGQIDPVFRKKEALPRIEQVGGGEAGQAPSESARILFWGNDHGCKMCDMNFASVAIGTGCANAGKIVLTTSPKDDFSEGYFVAVEAIAEQVTVDALTSGMYGYSGTYNTYGNKPGYSSDRAYLRKYDADAIDEPTTYIESMWPSANVIDYPVNWGRDSYNLGGIEYGTYATSAVSTMPNLAGYFTAGIGNLSAMYGGGKESDPINDGSQVLTFTKYTVTCGTVDGGSLNTISTRAVWSGIDVSSAERSSIWIGIGDGYIKTGLGRYVFMPSMSISQLKQDQWRQGETYWKANATPGTLVDVPWVEQVYANILKRGPQRTAGLAAMSASGMNVLGTAVTEAPKSRALRSTLVTSPLGLIWKDYVFAGINADHTTKATKWPETVWPMEQPSQSVALSIGAAKQTPISMTVKFETETKITTSYNTDAINALVTGDMIDKPLAGIGVNVVEDETGRIGRDFVGNFFVEGITAVNYRDTPQRAEWEGVFDYELQRIEDTKSPRQNDFATSALPYIDNGSSWYGNSTQSKFWKTMKTDDYTFTVESIRPRTNAKAFWDGEFTATNVMPDGTATAGDFFYASPDRSGDVVESLPTMRLPAIANRSIAETQASMWFVNGQSMWFPITAPVNSYASGIPSIAPYLEQFDQNGSIKLIGFGGWTDVSATHSATPTKFSVDVVAQRMQTVRQSCPFQTAVDEGWMQPSGVFTGYPAPRSEFYKADYSRLDDLNQRLCSVAKMAMIKSCRWIPKQTQMFCLLKRGSSDYSWNPYALPGGWGYYGGTVPDKDVLQMLDQYSSAYRGRNDPAGGSVLVVLRRSWQIELTIVTGNPTCTPCEVIADNLQRYNGFVSGYYSWDRSFVSTTFNGTRQVKFTVSFDVDEAEEVTHRMNHEAFESVVFPMTEQQFTDFESGQEMSFKVSDHSPWATSSTRVWGNYQGVAPMYARQETTAKIKLN